MKLWPWSRNTTNKMTEEEVFQQSGEPLVIPIRESLEWLVAYVTEALPNDLASLDKKVREASSHRPADPLWPQISANELEHILRAAETPTALLGLVSFHPSGYVREAAIRRLIQVKNGQELSFLLLRLNDWVTPVYELVLTAVQARITCYYADALIRSISLIFALGKQGRHSHQPILSAIINLLKQPDCDSALQKGMVAPDKQTRRLCFRILREADDDRLPDAVQQRLTDPDPVIRLAAARSARLKLPDDILRILLPLMRRDRSMPVRREAFYACLERLPELASEELMTALLDTHVSVRGAARHHLRLASDFDSTAFYRQALAVASRTSDLEAAIGGLGETGAAADAALLAPHLAHRLAKVRQAAVRAISRLDGDNQVDRLMKALADERPSVTHEAREALRLRLAVVNERALWQLVKMESHIHVRRDALALLARLPKWQAIPFLVEAAVDPDPPIQEWAVDHLNRWSSRYNSSFVKPTSGQLARLEEALRINPFPHLLSLIQEWKARGAA